jgi:hypothetical protein
MDFEILTMVPTRVCLCSTQPTFACEDQGDRDDDHHHQIYTQIVCCHVAAAFYQSISSGYWRASYRVHFFSFNFEFFLRFFNRF